MSSRPTTSADNIRNKHTDRRNDMTKIVTLKVVGDNKMNCAGCERSVTATLAELPGVREVKADHRTQNIDVTLTDGETGIDVLQSELQEIGYTTEAA
jgi:copper chaperone CopZ